MKKAISSSAIRRTLARAKDYICSTKIGAELLLPQYRFMFAPSQLAELCRLTDEVINVPGSFVEVGVYQGNTTIFLNEHLRHREQNRRYYCIDTFSGFTEEDIGSPVGCVGGHGARPGSVGQRPPRVSMAMAMRASGL